MMRLKGVFMKWAWIMAVPILLAACQSDSQVRSSAPLASYSSSRSPNEAVACLTTSLPARWNASSAMMNQRFVGQVIVPNQEYDVVPVDGFVNGHYTFTVNVKGSGRGSTLNLFKGQAMLPGITAAVKQGVADCR